MTEKLEVISDDKAIIWAHNGVRKIAFGWQVALEVCALLDAQIRAALAPEAPLLPELSVSFNGGALVVGFRVQGETLLVLGNGRLLFDLPAAAARQLWNATIGKARQLQELDPATADRLALDAGLALRAGLPFGMTDNAAINDAAKNLAAHDRTLRQMPMAPGVQSREILGAPVLTVGNRAPDAQLKALMARMAPADRRSLFQTLSQEPARENQS